MQHKVVFIYLSVCPVRSLWHRWALLSNMWAFLSTCTHCYPRVSRQNLSTQPTPMVIICGCRTYS